MPRRRSRAAQGFTIVEMVVTLFILVLVIVGVLGLFDLASKVSRVQVDTADMQQVVRTAQYDMIRMLRMAGRGKVPRQSPPPAAGPWVWSHPNGVAVGVLDNVPTGTFVDNPTASNHPVLPGTDVLTIRGVLTSPVYLVDSATFTVLNTVPTAVDNGGSFTIRDATPQGGVPQSLDRIAEAIENKRPEALVLVSPDDDSISQIVMLDPDNSTVAAGRTSVTVRFRLGRNEYADAYWQLSGAQWNVALTKLAYVGIVEEYRYYVADVREKDGVAASAPKPQLRRARLYPGAAKPWGSGPDPDHPGAPVNDEANWSVPMADNVADLQVALGIETGVGTAFTITDDGTGGDEWLFNSAADVPTSPAWRNGRLRYVRINTTGFSERREQAYTAPGFTGPPVVVEDHSYSVPEFGSPSQNVPDRMYRRRTLKTIVDLRNL
ncbi:MAG TPA: hypothetical protein VFS60_00585 [Thermoanaerobaculia bacterium]|nr:hypothetical protein [Thermoanaerobaculia bacterium]